MFTILRAKVLSKCEKYTREKCKSECEKEGNLRYCLNDEVWRWNREDRKRSDEEDEEEWDT